MSVYRSLVQILERRGLGPPLRSLLSLLRRGRRRFTRVVRKARSRKEIRRYLESHAVKKLHIGASDEVLDGWLNTDIVAGGGIVYLDCLRPFPFEDDTLDFVFCEHFIEHTTRESGLVCMSEVFRCLKPGGVFRVTTPDLTKFVGLFAPALDATQARYIEEFRVLSDLDRLTPCRLLNIMMHGFQHQYLYTEKELIEHLSVAGFSLFQSAELGESRHEALRNIERHRFHSGDETARFETMFVEAAK